MTISADIAGTAGSVAPTCAAMFSVDIEVLEHRSLSALARVFHEAVWAQLSQHDAPNDAMPVSGRYQYSEGQCRAWSGKVRDVRYWRSRLSGSLVLVAKVGAAPVGFIDCELGFRDRGYIGHLYVAPAFQRRGIGAMLLQALIARAPSLGVARLWTDASFASKALFSAHGFDSLGRTYQQKCGQYLPGFAMTKSLPWFVDHGHELCSEKDIAAIAELFHAAVVADDSGTDEYYTKRQRQAWSPEVNAAAVWRHRLGQSLDNSSGQSLEKPSGHSRLWLARAQSGEIVGFSYLKLAEDGLGELEYLYVAPAWQRQGVGRALYLWLEKHARQLRLPGLKVQASYVARPLLLSLGFEELCCNHIRRGDEVLVNFTLEKSLKVRQLSRQAKVSAS